MKSGDVEIGSAERFAFRDVDIRIEVKYVGRRPVTLVSYEGTVRVGPSGPYPGEVLFQESGECEAVVMQQFPA